MQCLIKCYCKQCDEEFTGYTDITGHLLPQCPKCKDKTDFDLIEEIETIQVG